MTGSIEPEAHMPVNAVPLPALTKSSSRGAWLLQWRAGQRKTIYLCMLVLGSCALFLLVYLLKIWAEYEDQTPGHPARFVDFFSLWSYAKIASTHPVAELYDSATLHARQLALGMAPNDQSPFPYPPTVMLLLWPLNLLPYAVSYLVWMLGTLALFVWAVWGTCSRSPLCLLGIIVAPASTLTIYAGQSGFLAAALIVAGVRLAGSRPVLAGFLIGLLSYKPQLGFLVPIAFASAGLWPAFGVACATVVGLALLATLAFGWAVWPAWVSMLPAYADWFDQRPEVLKFMPTVMGNLRMAGVSLPIARGAQALVAIAVAVLVARCFRRNPDRLAAAALLVGTILATPHAFFYELPMAVAAVALFIEARLETSSTFNVAEVLVLMLAVLFPALMLMEGINLPVSAVPLVLLFGLIVLQQNHSTGNVRRLTA
jgi:hypothetical protein